MSGVEFDQGYLSFLWSTFLEVFEIWTEEIKGRGVIFDNYVLCTQSKGASIDHRPSSPSQSWWPSWRWLPSRPLRTDDYQIWNPKDNGKVGKPFFRIGYYSTWWLVIFSTFLNTIQSCEQLVVYWWTIGQYSTFLSTSCIFFKTKSKGRVCPLLVDNWSVFFSTFLITYW